MKPIEQDSPISRLVTLAQAASQHAQQLNLALTTRTKRVVRSLNTLSPEEALDAYDDLSSAFREQNNAALRLVKGVHRAPC